MYCKNCGNNLRDSAKFCPACGTPVSPVASRPSGGEPAAPSSAEKPPIQTEKVAAPVTTTEFSKEEPILGRKKSRGLLPIVLAAAGAIAVVAVLVTMLLNLVGGPKLKVARAAEKTLKAYQTAAERAGLPDPAKLMELMESKAYSADFSVELNSLLSGGYYFYDRSTLEGIKLHAGMDFSMKDRSLVYAVDANYGSAELLSGTIALEDTILKLYSPQILKDQAFGLDTMTLGEDLAGLDSNSELDIENVSFNLFDFLERIYRKPEIDKKATQALIDAIEIEEAGEESMDINGKTMVCVRYDVLIPEDALRDYVDALEDATDNLELDSTILDFMRSIGVPEDEVGAMKGSVRDALSQSFDDLSTVIRAVGDIELSAYVEGGYIMALMWEPRVAGNRVTVGAYFGGGKNFADDLSLYIAGQGGEISLESSGDHSASSGTYSDLTTVRIRSNGETIFDVEWETEYCPKEKEDNFLWILQGDGFSLEAEGTLSVDGSSVDMALDDVAVEAYGMEIVSLAVDWRLRPYEKRELSAENVLMLSEMSLGDLEDFILDIQDNVYDWETGLSGDLSNLLQVF